MTTPRVAPMSAEQTPLQARGYDCPRCGGTGQVMYHDMPDGSARVTTCPRCDGTGRRPADPPTPAPQADPTDWTEGVDDTWEVEEDDWETGQPNGVGTIEPSTDREWYHDGRVTHRRRRVILTGPWEPWTLTRDTGRS